MNRILSGLLAGRRILAAGILIFLFFSDDLFSLDNPFEQLKTHWISRKTFLSQEDWDGSNAKLEILLNIKRNYNIRNLKVYSFALLREIEISKTRKPEFLIKLAEYAIQFSPDLYQPYFVLVKLKIRDKFSNIFNVLPVFFRAIFCYFSPTYHPEIYINYFYNFFAALLLGFFTIAFLMYARHSNDFVNHFKALIKNNYFSLPLSILLWLSLFLSIYYFGMIFTALLMFLLILRYLPLTGKFFALFFGIFVLCVPIILYIPATILNMQKSDSYLAYSVINGDIEEDSLKKVEGALSLKPASTELAFAKAYLLKKLGDFKKAEEAYKSIPLNPELKSIIELNLANIAFLKDSKNNTSLQQYERLNFYSSENSSLASYYYNKAKLISYSSKTDQKKEIENFFRKAEKLDWDLTQDYRSFLSSHFNRYLIDFKLPKNYLLSKIIFDNNIKYLLKGSLELLPNFLLKKKLLPSIYLSFILILYILLIFFLDRGVYNHFICVRCGEFLENSKIFNKYQKLCNSCYKLIVLKSPMNEIERITNNKTTNNYLRLYELKQNILRFLVIGTLDVFKGYSFSAWLKVVLFYIIFNFVFLPEPFLEFTKTDSMISWVMRTILLLVLLWIYIKNINIREFFLKEKN